MRVRATSRHCVQEFGDFRRCSWSISDTTRAYGYGRLLINMRRRLWVRDSSKLGVQAFGRFDGCSVSKKNKDNTIYN